MRRLIYRVVIVSTITFLICEAWLQTYDPFGLDYFGEVFEYVDGLEYNENYSYRHKASDGINSLGMRWHEVGEKTGKRLLILGDSVVFGWGVKPDRIFPEVLEDLWNYNFQLNKMTNSKYREKKEVVAAGVGSWNTVDESRWLRENLDGLRIDELLLVITGNDMLSKKSIENIKDNRLRSVKKVLVGNSKACALAYWLYKKADARYPTPNEVGSAKSSLLDIYYLCQDIEIKILLYGTKASIKQDFTLSTFSNYFERLNWKNLKVYELPENLLIQENQISKIDRHLNDKGHWMLAKYISEEIL